MHIGLRIPGTGPQATAENLIRLAGWAEALGYQSVWVSDHVILPERVESKYPYAADGRWTAPADTPWLDPLLVLAWAAMAAPSVQLSMSVLVLPLRNPILLAKQLATLDVLSGGRVMLGVGAGWMEEEFTMIGVPFAERGKRADEMVRLMRELWTGETVTFDGAYWQVRDSKMHPRPVHGTIPVVWGGHSDAALRRIARLGDGWHPTLLTLDELAAGIGKLRGYCERYGRDFGSVSIIARPSARYAITAETQARHAELGVTHVIADVPLTGPDLADARREMERIAHLTPLTPR